MKKLTTYYFCIDGGETKSIAILYDNKGKILSKSKSDSGNSFNNVYNVEKNINLLFSSTGEVLWLKKESDMDIVTAISGSGPAYVFKKSSRPCKDKIYKY